MKPTNDDIAGFGALKFLPPSPLTPYYFQKFPWIEKDSRHTVGYTVIIIFILKGNTLL